eukprot:m.120376 g.120376  ORF g.120376 m.120376 type:complete len:66 (+) comp15494_c2_seq1:532-729(+)
MTLASPVLNILPSKLALCNFGSTACMIDFLIVDNIQPLPCALLISSCDIMGLCKHIHLYVLLPSV